MSPAAVEVRIPRLAESISEGTLAEWLKPDGAQVRMDEAIATLETDKAAVEIAATEAGVLRHARKAGETVKVNDVIARIEPGAATATAPQATPAASASGKQAGAAATPAVPRSAPTPVAASAAAPSGKAEPSTPAGEDPALSPAVRRLLEEHRLSPSEVEATGKGGRLLKEDVLRHVESRAAGATPEAPEPQGANGPGAAPVLVPAATPLAARGATAPPEVPRPTALGAARAPASPPRPAGSGERVVPMSRIRQRIAERLVQAQHVAAILTTFNEIDMTAVMDARSRWKDAFEKRHGVKLGFMSFFGHACVLALSEVPELNAEVRGTDIVYKDFVNLGVAVGTERGLIVPVVKDAHLMSFADVEREIARLAESARTQTLTLDELAGGTFTISNGGVYGSLMSTPILNPPQSGILGMHKIEKRPIAANDQVVIRPMMYVALSYDHRIVDGEQAVTFLVRVKERLEDPERMLLEV